MNKLKAFIFTFILSLCMLGTAAYAKELDRILDYEIVIEPRDDGTLDMVYSFKWKVLSNDEGPLTWVKIGLPNSHLLDSDVLSDNINYIYPNMYSGNYMEVYFYKSYSKGDVVEFSFKIHQDYMYEMNTVMQGQTKYSFTPGWFDDIKIDKLTIKWKADKTTSWSPNCLNKDGYLTWETELGKGKTYTVDVYYDNSALNFNSDKFISNGDEYYQDDNYYYNDRYNESNDDASDVALTILGVIFFYAVILIVIFSSISSYNSSANLGSAKTKITRTVIKYYESCPSCGGQRVVDGTTCNFCGRSMIESEKVIKEEQLDAEYKDAAKYKENGTFAYGTHPNTYIRVNVVHVPAPAPRNNHRSGGGCAHSSCACAHSCACACACACAGGGRAGCTEKDFYNTGLKLKALELKKKKGNK